MPSPGVAATASIRAALGRGEALGPALAATGHALDLTALCPFARWLPKIASVRIFDTRFYLAGAADDAAAEADGGESVRAVWTTAAAALADADRGGHRIIFPTRRNLERLALAGSHRAACEGAARHPPAIVSPWVEQRGGEDWLCIREDQGYPVTAERVATALRG